jgi:DNA-directed RNA polymerase subunit RPC12/RpoP
MIARNEPFKCEHCGQQVAPIKYGGSYRNHCPYCLWSKHVDTDEPGNRKSDCLGMMEPVGVFARRTGEYVLVHRCANCGLERYNRIAGDDNFPKVIQLSTVPVKLRSN